MLQTGWLRAAAVALSAWAAVPGIAQTSPGLSEGWSQVTWPAKSNRLPLTVLKRQPATPPRRLRVIFIPGSGCSGMAPIASRYFAALLHAEVWVLQKPGVDIHAGPSSDTCNEAFIAGDALSWWQEDAVLAINTLYAANTERLPTWLVGVSEGGELLPGLMRHIPDLHGLVLLSASGLNPSRAGHMQARAKKHEAAWRQMIRLARSDVPDMQLAQGRTLKYWRDLLDWQIEQHLLDAPWPLLQVWGSADIMIPPAAYEEFAQRAADRRMPFCSWSVTGADHGLQLPDGTDGLQWVWGRIESWARSGKLLCPDRIAR